MIILGYFIAYTFGFDEVVFVFYLLVGGISLLVISVIVFIVDFLKRHFSRS
jgi:hypothetical protein